jgi:hypothetical protein
MKEMDLLFGLVDPPPDGFYLPAGDTLSAKDVLAVDFDGGYCWPSCWRLWITADGILSQALRLFRDSERLEQGCHFRQRIIGKVNVERILNVAERIGFAAFSSADFCEITDAALKRITLRIGSELKSVGGCGIPSRGFDQVWWEIHRHAPYYDGVRRE